MADQSPEFEIDESKLEILLEKQHQILREADVDIIYKACKGMGTNDRLLVSVLCARSKGEIAEIDLKYREAHGKSLLDLVKDECSGDYLEFLKAVVNPMDEYDRHIVNKACEGVGTNETKLIEVLIGRTPDEIHAMRAKFDAKFPKGLYETLRSELSGEMEDLLLGLAKQPREDGPADPAKAARDAEAIHKAAKGFGCDKKAIFDILKQNRAHIQAVKEAYEAKYNSSLKSLLDSELSGALEDAANALLWPNKHAFLAYKLKKAMSGTGTDESTIARILGGHDKDQVRVIAKEFFRMYNERLHEALKKEVGGNFRRALLAWLNIDDPHGVAVGANLSTVEKANELGKALAERDADHIHLASKGIGTNEAAIINIICRRNKSQIQRIDSAYFNKYGRGLSRHINKECGGDFKKILKYIAMPTHAFDAYMLKKACMGIGTDETLLIDVLGTLPNDRLFQAKQSFERSTGGALVDRLRGEVSGDLDQFVIKRIRCDRSEDPNADQDLAAQQAEQLAANGDFATALEILGSASVAQVQAIKVAFEGAQNKSLGQDIRDKFTGSSEKALLSLIEDPVDYQAARLKRAFGGAGTNESEVARILGGLDKKEVAVLAEHYFNKFSERVQEALGKELSGSFRDACVAWVAEPEHTEGLEDSIIVLKVNESVPLDEDSEYEAEPEQTSAPPAPEPEPEPEEVFLVPEPEPYVPPPPPTPEPIILERSGEERVNHSGGPVRATNNFPAKTYLGATVGSAVSQIRVSCTAADQGWGGEGSSFLELVVLDGSTVKAAHNIGSVRHGPAEFSAELGSDFTHVIQRGDRIELRLVSAPWPGWACRGYSARLEYLPA